MSYLEKDCKNCKDKTIHEGDRCIECQPYKNIKWGDAMKSHNIMSTDIMEPTVHPATGRVHTSPSKFRQDTKAAGCVEVGNEYAKGYDPQKEASKESAKRLERNLHQSFREALNK